MIIGVGFVGAVVPFIPGTVLILVGALVHRLALGPEQSVGWWTLGGLALLTALSYALELAAGSLGAKVFGATRWGVIGGIIGGVVGLFFGPVGWIAGPILGVLAGELMGGQRFGAASWSTWGTVLGSLFGLVAKVAISVVMVVWFVLALL